MTSIAQLSKKPRHLAPASHDCKSGSSDCRALVHQNHESGKSPVIRIVCKTSQAFVIACCVSTDILTGLSCVHQPATRSRYFNIDEYAFQTFLWSHGLMPSAQYQASVTACGWDSFFTNCSTDFTHPSDACKAANKAALQFVPQVWDPYNVLTPTCHTKETTATKEQMQMTPFLRHLQKVTGTQYNPCMEQWTAGYMNRPDVLKAIHAEAHVCPCYLFRYNYVGMVGQRCCAMFVCVVGICNKAGIKLTACVV